jgi:hypothetical protein
MKRILHIIFIIGMLISFVSAQNLFPILGGQLSGTSVFTFLNIGVSARAVGMGESVVALNQDASSVYYNPAGHWLWEREISVFSSWAMAAGL